MENHLETYLSTVLQRLEKATQEILRTSTAALKKETPRMESAQEKKHEDPRSSNRQAS
jgi:hypothetical protein